MDRKTRKKLRFSESENPNAVRVESEYWTACYTDADGKRRQVSTGETVESKALAKAIDWEKPYRDSLSAEKSCLNALGVLRQHKDLLQAGYARKEFRNLYEDVFAVEIEAGTVRRFAEGWLNRRKAELARSSYVTYKQVLERFVEFIGEEADSDIRLLRKERILAYRNSVVERLTPRTANNHLKTLRVFFNDARRDELIDRNPAEDVRRLSEGKEYERRAFTISELKSILKVASGEWRGLILFGLYTGQRMGDVVRLTWANIDLEEMKIQLTSAKTKRRVSIPLVSALSDYLAELDPPEDSTAPIFPEACERANRYGANGPLSKEFRDILVQAGLVKASVRERNTRKSPNKGKGHSNRRRASVLSYHCLRHSATSMLKNAGVSEAVVMDIVGHDSKAVSQLYTHVEDAPKREALSKMPDITRL